MFQSRMGRALGSATLLTVGLLMLGTGVASADTTAAVSGSVINVNGDQTANNYSVGRGGGNKIVIQDVTQRKVTPGAGCARFYYGTLALTFIVVCEPTSGPVSQVNLNYKGGDETTGSLRSGLPRIALNGGPGNDTLRGAPEGSTFVGGAGNDRLIGAPLTTINGVTYGGIDTMADNDGNDTLDGGGGYDYLFTNDGKPGDTPICRNNPTQFRLGHVYRDAGDAATTCAIETIS